MLGGTVLPHDTPEDADVFRPQFSYDEAKARCFAIGASLVGEDSVDAVRC